MPRRGLPRLALLGLVGLLCADGQLSAQERPRLDASIRPGYHGLWRTDRDGGTSEASELRARIQTGARWDVTPHVQLRGRLAGRISTEQDGFHFLLRDHVPTTDGLRLGDATVDELHLRLRPGENVALRVGRLQTVFELAGVPCKSLDRNDSPNSDITWTDGVHLIAGHRGWNHHLIVQHNAAAGPTNVVRGPLDFSDRGSRASLFLALQADAPAGPIIQRELSLTLLPATLPVTTAAGHERRSGYLALTARGAAQLPVTVAGGRVVLAAEVGYAPRTPERSRLGTLGEGDGSGHAFQLSANLLGASGHSLGLVHARTGDGWLISPDIRDNNREWEARYYWQYARWGRLDLRYRLREDQLLRVGGERTRLDRDVYVRTTVRF